MSSSNLEVVQELYEAFGRGDVPAVLERLSPEIEWHEAEGFPYGGTYRGHDEVLEGVFARLDSEWDDFRVAPERFVDGDDVIVALGEYSGTYLETGRDFRAPFAHVWDVDGGRAVRFQQHTDTAVVQQAL